MSRLRTVHDEIHSTSPVCGHCAGREPYDEPYEALPADPVGDTALEMTSLGCSLAQRSPPRDGAAASRSRSGAAQPLVHPIHSSSSQPLRVMLRTLMTRPALSSGNTRRMRAMH